MINEICTECGGQGGDVVNGPFCPNCGGTGQTISKIDGILEELHNSWLDDDYEFDDPCGVHAKQQFKDTIISNMPRKVKAEMPNQTTIAYNHAIDDVISVIEELFK